MRRIRVPDILAKAGLAPHKPRLYLASAAAQSALQQAVVLTPVAVTAAPSSEEAIPVRVLSAPKTAHPNIFTRVLDLMHRYSIGAFALLFLLVGAAATQAGAAYWTAYRIKPITSSKPIKHDGTPLHGPNMSVPANQLNATVQQITAQPINLVIGAKTVPVDPTVIKSWLHIVTDKKTDISYIHLNETMVGSSLKELTSPYEKAPVNQVTTTYPNGSSAVIVTGRDGVSVGNPTDLAKQLAPNVLGGKGTQLNVPVTPVAFQAVTPAAFDKLIEVNVNTHQMYLYDKGNFTRQYAISAGAPATPTPIGQFKVYAKFAMQDMKGFNPDGSKYLQPHVRWISYFKAGGYAVHGNYWRPASVFGFVNTSHGCVSLPEDQAKVVYDWTTIGTTVIVHT